MKSPNERGELLATESFSLENHPFYLFHFIFMHRARELNRAMAGSGMDYPRWRILSVVQQYPQSTMQSLADIAGMDRTTLTHTVRLLSDAGLIMRETLPHDRRITKVSLTPDGERAFRDVLPIISDSNKRHFKGFSDEEVRCFIETLQRIACNIRNTSPPPSSTEGEDDLGHGPPSRQARR